MKKVRCLFSAILTLGMGVSTSAWAQAVPGFVEAPPLPPQFDRTPRPPLAPGNPNVPPAFRPIPAPNTVVQSRTISVQNPNAYLGMGTNVLVFNSDVMEVTAKPGESHVPIRFQFSNATPTNVVISQIRPSCGCTVPKMPAVPWVITPGSTNDLEFTMDIRGKSGTVMKMAYLESNAGNKTLGLRVIIPATVPGVENAMGNRAKNLEIAAADRQAVFRGDCAKCHLEPIGDKLGEPLYAAACGICHDAEHRSTIVPDLRNLNHPTDRGHWERWVTAGRPGSLMPAFSKTYGGPLTDEQIRSLVDFLDTSITQKKPAASGTPSASATAPAATSTPSTAPKP